MRRLGIHLVIHYDPVSEDSEWAAYRKLVKECAYRITPDATIHDLRILDYRGKRKLSFDLAVPYSLPLYDEDILRRMKDALHLHGCSLHTEIQIDRTEE